MEDDNRADLVDSDTEEEDHLRSDDEAHTDREMGATIRDKLLCPSAMIPTCAGFTTPQQVEDSYALTQTQQNCPIPRA